MGTFQWWRLRRGRERRAAIVEEARAELRFHLAEEVDRRVEAGLTAEAAMEEVEAEMGSWSEAERRCLAVVERAHRRARARAFLGSLVRDVRQGAVVLRRRPVPTLASVVTMAVGIGAATTMLSVADGVAWRPLPYPEPDELVRLAGTFPTGGMGPVPGPLLEDWQRHAESFDAIAGAFVEPLDLLRRGAEPVRLQSAATSVEYGRVTGLEMAHGRWFAPSEDDRHGQRVAVLAHGAWVEHFGGEPTIVGSVVHLNDRPVTIVGIASPDHRPPDGLRLSDTELWIPLHQATTDVTSHENWYLRTIGRLRDGVSLDAARNELATLTARLVATYPPENYERGFDVQMEDLHQNTTGGTEGVVWLLLGSVGLLLFIACANVTHLNLVRSQERARDFGLRRAIGASRFDVTRQLIVESLLVAAAGGVLGMVLASGGVALFQAYDPGDLPRVADIAVDRRVALLALALIGGTGIAAGFVPALKASAAHGPGFATDRQDEPAASRLRNGLVTLEVAVALVLLASGALLGSSLWRLTRVDPGFERDGVTVLHLQLAARYDDRPSRIQFFEELSERLEGIDGVTATGFANGLPFGSGGSMGSVVVESPAEGDRPKYARWQLMDHGFLDAIGVSVVEGGRGLGAAEARLGDPLVLVNESFARTYWPDRPARGQRLKIIRTDPDAPWLEVIGVVPDFSQGRLDRETTPEVFLPYGQPPFILPSMDFVVRSALPLESLATALREAVWAVDSRQPVTWISSLDDRVSASLGRHRFYAAVLAVFGAAALVLTAAGIYGTVAYSVSLRSREFGVRIALGATNGAIGRDVLGRSARGVSIGLVLGLGGTATARGLVEPFMFGLGPTHVPTVAGAVVFLAVVATFASIVPARRATRTDPVRALRS